jgi:hypothetical protein
VATRRLRCVGMTEPDSAAQPSPVWAVAATVVEQRPYGSGSAVQRRGLRLFSGGAKVYVVDGFGGMGYETVTVVGRPRKSSRFSIVHVRAEHLSRWRVELVYSPAAMRKIAEVRDGPYRAGFWLPDVADPGASAFRDALEEVAAVFAGRSDEQRARRLATTRQDARDDDQTGVPTEPDPQRQGAGSAPVGGWRAGMRRAWRRLRRA